MTKPFSPVDKDGNFVAACSSAEEIEGLVVWLNRQDKKSKETRKKAYAVEASLMAGHPSGPSPEAKASLVSKACGDAFHHWIRRCSNAAGAELKLGGTAKNPADAKEAENVKKAEKVLKGLLRSLQEEMFGELLGGVAKMQKETVSDLVKILRENSAAIADIVKILSEKTEAAMEDSLRAYRRSEKSRQDIKRSKGSAVDKMDSWGVYGPLLKYLSEELCPAQRAEFLERFALYVESGWAAKDLLSGQDAKGSVSEMNQAMVAFMKGEPGSNDRIKTAIEMRFSNLFLDIQVQNAAGSEGDLRSTRGRILGKVKADQALAGSGRVDCAIISPDGERILARFASSDECVESQQTQWVRHSAALRNLLENGDFEDFGATKGAKLSIGVSIPCTFSKRGGFGTAMMERLWDKELSGDAIERANLIHPMGALVRGKSSPSEMAELQMGIWGSEAGEKWSASMEMARESSGESRDMFAQRVFCSWVGGIWGDMKAFGWKDSVPFHGIGDDGRALVKSLLEISSKAMKMASESNDLRKALFGRGKDREEGLRRMLSSVSENDLPEMEANTKQLIEMCLPKRSKAKI